MDKAKAAVSQFVGRSGHHDTTVDERQLPAVRHEEVQPVRKEEITTAIDREIQQDHYHTTVQPIKDREVLPEKHSHQMAGVQTKEFEHANPQDTRARLEREAQQFKDTSVQRNTQHVQAMAPTVEGERIHHHVHETVQPVIEKEVIAPSVVHTTVPIHERHHAAPEHHGVSVLPTKTMTDFKSTGQNLTGTGIINQDKYDGCPRPYNSELQLSNTDADANPHLHTSGIASQHGSNTSGPHNSNLMNKTDPRVDSDRDGRGIGSGIGGGAMGTGMAGSHSTAGPHSSNIANKADPRVDSDRDGREIGSGMGSGATGTGMGGTHSTAGPHSSDIANKADPRVDSDRDGRGFGSGVGGGAMGTGMAGSHSTAGPHSSNIANKADPRVDSDLDGSNRSTGTGMTGTSNPTAGPHGSNAANKLDPRVDSDRSASHHQGASPMSPVGSGHTSSHASGVSDPAGHKKPSLMDRLNPMKDSDGDGKKGFMK